MRRQIHLGRNKEKSNDDSGFYEPYGSFSKLLRTWLISYGIGLIVFLVSQKTTVETLKKHPDQATTFFTILLAGVAVQVLAAFIYKYSMGYLYYGELEGNEYKKKRRYKVADWFSEALFIELIFDAVTIILYIFATYKIIGIMLSCS